MRVDQMSQDQYTALSFAPVQGFIEKSRKLRDLFGASLILSFLSQKIAREIEESSNAVVISPALINLQKGMPNRILVRGFISRDQVKNILFKHWQWLLKVCREWIQQSLPAEYYWSQKEDQIGEQKGEWERWGSYAWEIFWGTGSTPQEAMDDLESRKLKRDWTAINWIGESSSLTGRDAIAWNRLGAGTAQPGLSLTVSERQELDQFYLRLAWILDDLSRASAAFPSDEELQKYFETTDGGKFITHRERLSIPELVKRLVTLPKIAKQVEMETLEEGFRDIYREPGYWTGWFMGDGDQIGNKLKLLAEQYPSEPENRDRALTRFTELMRQWGQDLEKNKALFPQGKGRIIYAGGDDFLGVLYSGETQTGNKPDGVAPLEAWNWLLNFPGQWAQLQRELKQELAIDLTYSVGFVWAGHQVPQRDILQHCREAEKRAKSLGRDRVTIRVLFNSGQYVQWTCPWSYLYILTRYRDREGINTESELNRGSKKTANWGHLYSDWATLKARHAIRLRDVPGCLIDRGLAVSMLDLYFDGLGEEFEQEGRWTLLAGDNSDLSVVRWINDLVQIGWQLCSNI